MRIISALLALFMAIPFVNSFTCFGPGANCTSTIATNQKRGLDTFQQLQNTAWPGGRIPYCYVNLQTRQILSPHIDAAIKIWMDALGGPASQHTGHSLSFTEIKTDSGAPKFCYGIQYQNPSNRGPWNPMINQQVVVLEILESTSAIASVGYNQLLPLGVHSLRTGIPGDVELWKYVLAHEIGHVLGLNHEHQRPDRDRYIKVSCEKIKGYAAALKEATKHMVVTLAHRRLCNDEVLARHYGFGGTDYLIYTYGRTHGPYDTKSIMHYSSQSFSNLECTPENVGECPITDLDGNFIYPNAFPSRLDAEAVKALYPA